MCPLRFQHEIAVIGEDIKGAFSHNRYSKMRKFLSYLSVCIRMWIYYVKSYEKHIYCNSLSFSTTSATNIVKRSERTMRLREIGGRELERQK